MIAASSLPSKQQTTKSKGGLSPIDYVPFSATPVKSYAGYLGLVDRIAKSGLYGTQEAWTTAMFALVPVNGVNPNDPAIANIAKVEKISKDQAIKGIDNFSAMNGTNTTRNPVPQFTPGAEVVSGSIAYGVQTAAQTASGFVDPYSRHLTYQPMLMGNITYPPGDHRGQVREQHLGDNLVHNNDTNLSHQLASQIFPGAADIEIKNVTANVDISGTKLGQVIASGQMIKGTIFPADQYGTKAAVIAVLKAMEPVNGWPAITDETIRGELTANGFNPDDNQVKAWVYFNGGVPPWDAVGKDNTVAIWRSVAAEWAGGMQPQPGQAQPGGMIVTYGNPVNFWKEFFNSAPPAKLQPVHPSAALAALNPVQQINPHSIDPHLHDPNKPHISAARFDGEGNPLPLPQGFSPTGVGGYHAGALLSKGIPGFTPNAYGGGTQAGVGPVGNQMPVGSPGSVVTGLEALGGAAAAGGDSSSGGSSSPVHN